MQIIQSRRDFLAGLSAAGAAGILGGRRALAAEGPLETTTIRLSYNTAICFAPMDVAEAFLRTEGFTDIRYVRTTGGFTSPQMIASGNVDVGTSFAGTVVYQLDAGLPLTALAGLHAGCYELFARAPIRNVSDLKGRRVGIQTLASSAHLFLASMSTYVGLDPLHDIDWVTSPSVKPMQLFAEGKIDAFLGFPPEPQELRARKIGHVVVNSAVDRPWSQYFCCLLAARRQFVHDHPRATKRATRAVLKAADLCAADPRRMARKLVEDGFTPSYDYARQTLTELPYGLWRDYDPEDSLRFYALRLHEAGMLRTSPNALLADGTDWRFLNELKRELKA
jgi:NitT/TauT family transport system substrate-binding protein